MKDIGNEFGTCIVCGTCETVARSNRSTRQAFERPLASIRLQFHFLFNQGKEGTSQPAQNAGGKKHENMQK